VFTPDRSFGAKPAPQDDRVEVCLSSTDNLNALELDGRGPELSWRSGLLAFASAPAHPRSISILIHPERVPAHARSLEVRVERIRTPVERPCRLAPNFAETGFPHSRHGSFSGNSMLHEKHKPPLLTARPADTCSPHSAQGAFSGTMSHALFLSLFLLHLCPGIL
jgi:hypothetical protein